MPVWGRRAVISGLLLALGLPGRVIGQQWSIQASDAPMRWRTCRIVAPDYSGPCRVTFVTRGQGAINIHFDLDDSGSEGLTFVIPSDDLQTAERMAVGLVAQRFRSNRLETVAGVCALQPDSIRCISGDGAFSAQAVGRLR